MAQGWVWVTTELAEVVDDNRLVFFSHHDTHQRVATKEVWQRKTGVQDAIGMARRGGKATWNSA